jgi:dolichol-phosphate mannosyltransferase
MVGSREISWSDGVVEPELQPVYLVRPAELTIVVPTFNERDNVALLIDRLNAVLGGIDWEVIFFDDDSPDGTTAYIRDVAQTHGRVRCIKRIGGAV